MSRKTTEPILLEEPDKGIGNTEDWLDQTAISISKLSLTAAAYGTNCTRGNCARYTLPPIDVNRLLSDNPSPVRALGQDAASWEAALAAYAALTIQLTSQATLQRSKLQYTIDLEGTTVFNHIWETLSHGSQVTVRRDPRFDTANSPTPKDGRLLMVIVRDIHTKHSIGSTKMTGSGKEDLEDKFGIFVQGDLTLNDFHRLFEQWINRLKSIGKIYHNR